MIALYLTQSYTQVVHAKQKKAALEIIECGYLPNEYLSLLSMAAQLRRMFIDLQRVIPAAKAEEIYIVLPDFMFRSINCWNYTEHLLIDAAEYAHIPLERVVYSTPMEFQNKIYHKKTVCLLERSVMETIVTAAKEEGFVVSAIEPASAAFFRVRNIWDDEGMALFIDKEGASIASFNPVAGMFSYPLPEMLNEKACLDLTQLNNDMKIIIMRTEDLNQRTFRASNPDIPLYLFAQQPYPYRTLPALADRLRTMTEFPDMIDVEDADCDPQEFCIAVGTLLQNRMTDFPRKHPSLTVTDANVLPLELQKETKAYHRQERLQKYIRRGIAAALLIGAVEAVGIFFLGNIRVSEERLQEYQAAQAAMKMINQENAVIAQSAIEDQQPLFALESLMVKRPETLGFTDITIGTSMLQVAPEKRKDVDQQWIQLGLEAKEPVIIQDYAAHLSQSEAFRTITINQIAGNNRERLKTAKLTIAKGEIAHGK